MTKTQLTLTVTLNKDLSPNYSHIVLTATDRSSTELSDLPTELNLKEIFESIKPGQFVQVRIDGSKQTFLRRPISVNFVDPAKFELHLLVRNAGEGTAALCRINVGEEVNVIMPLGNGFTVDDDNIRTPLLIGGGVGVAPMLYLGKSLRDNGITPTFLLAGKSAKDLLMLDEFEKYGRVIVSTDDGSRGHHGLVTQNPCLTEEKWDIFYCCGPMPMMRGIADIARKQGVDCEVSLENTMACGLGACLCCVEDTVDGHVCVCTEGPVFNISQLKW